MNEEQMVKLRQLFGLNEDASVQDMIAALSAMSAEQVLGAVLAAIDKPPGGQDEEKEADPDADPEAEEEAPEPPSDDAEAEDAEEGSADEEEDEQEFDADDEEDDKAAEAYAVLREELNCDDPDTIRASLKALNLHKRANKDMNIRVAQLEAQIEQRDVRELVQANRKKIPPSLEKWALKQSLKSLKAFLEEAPDVVPLDKVDPPEVTEKPDALVDLTEAELMVCTHTGQDPQKLAEHKRNMRKRA